MVVSQSNLTAIDVTHDFDDSECFATGNEYAIVFRDPSSPGVLTGLSLHQNEQHSGWVKDRSRGVVEDFVKEEKEVKCRVLALGKRWKKTDFRLGVELEWREGKAMAWVDIRKD